MLVVFGFSLHLAFVSATEALIYLLWPAFYDQVSIYVSDMCTLQRNSVVPLVRLCAIRAAVENRIFVVLAGDRNTCSIVSARQLGCQRNSRRPLLDMGRRVSRRGWKSGLDANHQSPMRNYPRWTLLITTHEWLIYQAEERFRSYDCHLWERFEQWNTIQLVDQWHNDRIDHEWRQCYGSEPGHNVQVADELVGSTGVAQLWLCWRNRLFACPSLLPPLGW